jgi:hypothetical protein
MQCIKCNIVQCKTCDNEYRVQRKKAKRQMQMEKSIAKCNRCDQEKPLRDFAKMKKYDGKVCLTCYPGYLSQCKATVERKRNPNYRIKKSLAARLRNVLHKTDTTMNYVGCNIQFLREWLEYNFTKDMSWDNYGNYWSIDHVIPVSKFDLTIQDQQYKCWNWTNLFPVRVTCNSSTNSCVDEAQIRIVKQKIIKFKEEGSTTKWFSEDLCILLRYSLTFAER